MDEPDFTHRFTVAKPAARAFSAITDVRGWWSAAVTGGTARCGDEFEYRHGDVHYSRHRLIEVVSATKIVWLTVDSHIAFVARKQEWNDTVITFELEERGRETALTFTHRGLTPKLACYAACSGKYGWLRYLESLRKLIETGTGEPDAATERA